MLKNSLFATTLLACGIAGVTAAVAVTQGSAGATSTGTSQLSLVINNKLNVTNLADTALGTYSGADMTGSDSICVYYNQTASYKITFDGTNTPGTFVLDDGSSNTIPYTISYDDGGGASAITAATALTGQSTGGNTTDDDCVTATADNGTVAYTVLATDITGNPNGTYTDTVQITVAPDI